MHVEEDERIHGDSAFAEKVLDHASERMQRRYRLPAKGVSPDRFARKAGEIYGLEKEQLGCEPGGYPRPELVAEGSLILEE